MSKYCHIGDHYGPKACDFCHKLEITDQICRFSIENVGFIWAITDINLKKI